MDKIIKILYKQSDEADEAVAMNRFQLLKCSLSRSLSFS